MKTYVWYQQVCLPYFASAIASAIVYVGLVSVSFALVQAMPPFAMQVGAAVGGALSPSFWRLLAGRRTPSY